MEQSEMQRVQQRQQGVMRTRAAIADSRNNNHAGYDVWPRGARSGKWSDDGL